MPIQIDPVGFADIQNLQNVTTVGNTTSNDIVITGTLGIGHTAVDQLEIYGITPTQRIAKSSQAWSPGISHGYIEWFTDDVSGIGSHQIGQIGLIESSSATTPTPDMVFKISDVNAAALEAMRLNHKGNLGIGGTPSDYAILHIISTTKCFMPPQMTTAQRDALNSSTPIQGMVIYNLTTHKLEYYNGSAWA